MGSNPGTNVAAASPNFTWDEVIKKEARGTDDLADLGEVQEVGQHYVVTQRGTVNKEKFYLPKYIVRGFDGITLWFELSESEIGQFRRDTAPTQEEYAKYKKPDSGDIESRLPYTESKKKDTKDESHASSTT